MSPNGVDSTPTSDTAAAAELDPSTAPLPPGPGILQAPIVARNFIRDPYRYLPTLSREYGDVVSVPLGPMKMTLVSHPDHVNHFLNRHADRYLHSSGAMLEAFTLQGELPLPMRDGEEWKKHRKVMQPHFTEKGLKDVGDLVTLAVHEGIEEWRKFADTGRVVDLQMEFGVLAMSTLMRSHFSSALERSEIEDWVSRAHAHGIFAGKALVTSLPFEKLPWGMAIFRSLPWPHLLSGRTNERAMCATVDALIEERKANPTEQQDILNLLMASTFDDGSTFTHGELRAELLALMFAGFDTTAAVLSWSIGLLATNPDELAQAYAEVDALGLGDDEPVTVDHLPQLPYLRAVFDEAQRIQGSLPFEIRWAAQDDVIGGYRIRKGTTVAASTYGMGNDPRFWNEPEVFRPRRFLEDEINKYAFFPFGVGPRRCLGMRLAYMEGVLALASALQRYQFELPADWTPRRTFSISTALADLPVVVRRR